MSVIFKKFITRDFIKQNPNWTFVFGDNLDRVGFGGQARHMRGEPNSVGYATKVHGDMEEDSFFTNDQKYKDIVQKEFQKVLERVAFFKKPDSDTVLVLPLDGIGTGLSELPKRAPEIHNIIVLQFMDLVYSYFGGFYLEDLQSKFYRNTDEFPWTLTKEV